MKHHLGFMKHHLGFMKHHLGCIMVGCSGTLGILLLSGCLEYGVMRKSPNLYQIRVVELLNQYHLGRGNEIQTYFWRNIYIYISVN